MSPAARSVPHAAATMKGRSATVEGRAACEGPSLERRTCGTRSAPPPGFVEGPPTTPTGGGRCGAAKRGGGHARSLRHPGGVEDRPAFPGDPGGDKAPAGRRAYAGVCPAAEPGPRIDPEDAVHAHVVEVVRHEARPSVKQDHPVKVVEYVEPGKPEAFAEERIGHPRVEVVIVGRRRVVCDHWGPFLGIVVADIRGTGIALARRRRIRAGRRRSVVSGGGYALLGSHIVDQGHGLVPAHGQLAGVGRTRCGLLQLIQDIRGHRIIGYPPVSGGDAKVTQGGLGFDLVPRSSPRPMPARDQRRNRLPSP